MTLLHHHVRVDEYVSEEVPARRRAAMEHHLMRCPECRVTVAGHRRRERRRQALAEGTVVLATDTEATAVVGTRRRAISNAVPVLGSLLTVFAFVGVLVAAWNAGAAEDVSAVSAPTDEFSAAGVALSSYQVSDLRRAGWACPDLRPLGLEMTSSTGYRRGDVGSVTMTFAGEDKAVVITESRSLAVGAGLADLEADASGSGELRAEAAALTDEAATPTTSEDAGRSVTISAADGGRYVVHSSLSEADTQALVARLRDLSQDRAEDARAAAVSGWDRLTRGWARLVDPTR